MPNSPPGNFRGRVPPTQTDQAGASPRGSSAPVSTSMTCVVVEDEAMIGSRCMVVGGARVRRGATLGAGAILTPTTHVIDVETGDELPQGEAPAWSVCVGGTRPRKFPGGEFGLPCLLVLKRLPEGSRHDKATLNAILRDHGVDA